MYTINDLTKQAMEIIHEGLNSKDEFVRTDTAVKFLQVMQLTEFAKTTVYFGGSLPRLVKTKSTIKKKSSKK